MPKISTRAHEAYRSPIRELEDEAEIAKASGAQVLHLNIGQPDLETPPAAWEKLKQIDEKILAYGPARGLLSYRKALVSYYSRWGVSITAEDINITTGASEAIWLALNAVADPGDEIIVPEPFYALYNGFLMLGEVEVVPVSTTIEEAFTLPEIGAFEAVISSRTRAILLCNPSNPTGQVYSADQLDEIGRLAEKHDLYVIVDEVYREFTYDDVEFTSALAIPSLHNRAIVIDSVSKRFSACGARIGSLACRDAIFMEAVTRLSRFRLCPPTIGQIMCEAILANEGNYLEEARIEYDLRRKVLYEGLNAIPGVRCYLPKGAFYCFAELPVDDSEHFARWMLTSFRHEGATVMLAPGSGFYATPGKGLNEVRIAYVLNVQDIQKSLNVLTAALVSYQKIEPLAVPTLVDKC